MGAEEQLAVDELVLDDERRPIVGEQVHSRVQRRRSGGERGVRGEQRPLRRPHGLGDAAEVALDPPVAGGGASAQRRAPGRPSLLGRTAGSGGAAWTPPAAPVIMSCAKRSEKPAMKASAAT